MVKSFGRLKSFSAIMCLDNFSKKAYLDVDKTEKELKKYMVKLINFLAENENQWVKINTKNPRIWIDVDDKFNILVNEDWFSEIEK